MEKKIGIDVNIVLFERYDEDNFGSEIIGVYQNISDARNIFEKYKDKIKKILENSRTAKIKEETETTYIHFDDDNYYSIKIETYEIK